MIPAAGGGQIALPGEMRRLKNQGINAQVTGDMVHQRLHGKKDLGSAEPSVRAAGRGIGFYGAPVNADMGNAVYALRHEHSALEHKAGEGGICPCVEEHVHIKRRYPAVLDRGAVTADGGMPLGGALHILTPVQYTSNRLPALMRRNRHLAA